ncbi:hypothetical protein TG4357_01468 [Thalassovita gelatinovora]|uniref:Uncharacterized protein n=1 Tax=Thalassovita gelatinovora TaxID=53501 RepID=A0A0P1F9M2_THAGE|nr:hypothetical protein [Thalassovita gelatinovora]QIZ81190.1 hypothetical protein HFZ77_12265 [Thalassovita gelatinovora]CUH64741.1 hypothetical protein TG4357_01468 [Thalassovita gelatinovora]SEP92777.1 hypothetical protein SAMN04488043_102207 [Thalassovita gelatinovora]
MRVLSSAFFLACSWFWCIGGFFPVLLEAEFGQIAFAVFVVLNVTGATLFGFVMDHQKRARFLGRFASLAQAFSGVVVVYHFAFITWISTLIGSSLPLIGFVVLTCAFYAVRRHLIGMSIVVFAATLVLFAIAIEYPAQILPPPLVSDGFIHSVLPLAFGFLLAPYFDLTFHRAYANSPYPRLSFVIGIGGLFAVLMAGMFFATPILSGLLVGQGGAALAILVGLLVLQTAFTTAAHLRELKGSLWAEARLRLPLGGFIFLIYALHVAVAFVAPEFTVAFGDLIYRSFLFLIGAVFPVFLVFGGINRRALVACGFLAPCYTLGFLIGGVYAPFLSVGIVGLAILIILRPAPVLNPSR